MAGPQSSVSSRKSRRKPLPRLIPASDEGTSGQYAWLWAWAMADRPRTVLDGGRAYPELTRVEALALLSAWRGRSGRVGQEWEQYRALARTQLSLRPEGYVVLGMDAPYRNPSAFWESVRELAQSPRFADWRGPDIAVEEPSITFARHVAREESLELKRELARKAPRVPPHLQPTKGGGSLWLVVAVVAYLLLHRG